ncbi:MAG TPA: ATPase [Cyanothece sp. UBA12306]|nr:ATPase [Cyanothece sp. UBA12306]
MDLLEYQAKELFHRVGIPILPSQPIANLSELKRLHIPYPVVLKSQVRSGGRGKAGGIRFVENTIDAIAAAQAIFSLPILGEYPEVILAEARYNAQSEFFLCVLLDYQIQRPVLLGSAKGGIEIEALLNHIEKVVIDRDFSSFYARRLAIKMGLEGKLIHVVSGIIEKMYQLFCEKDLDWIEINPLAVSPTGEVMALDGKIAVNDASVSRHNDILTLLNPPVANSPVNLSTVKGLDKPKILGDLDKKTYPSAQRIIPQTQDIYQVSASEEPENQSLVVPNLQSSPAEGVIGIISNSWGLTVTTWDLLVQQKGKPNCAFVIEEKNPEKSLVEQFEAVLNQAMKLKQLRVILVNILGSAETSETIAQAIADYCQPYLIEDNGDRLPRPTGANTVERQRNRQGQNPSLLISEPLPLVVRLVGGELDSIKDSLSSLNIHWDQDLETTITQTLSLASLK